MATIFKQALSQADERSKARCHEQFVSGAHGAPAFAWRAETFDRTFAHATAMHRHVIGSRAGGEAENKMRRLTGLAFVTMLALAAQQAWALANPASVFCVQSGGKSEIRQGPRGQYGV